LCLKPVHCYGSRPELDRVRVAVLLNTGEAIETAVDLVPTHHV